MPLKKYKLNPVNNRRKVRARMDQHGLIHGYARSSIADVLLPV